MRIRDEQDRRVVHIHLLKEGERIIEEVIKKRQNYLHELLVDFDKEEVETLSKLLHKLHLQMEED